MVTGKIQSLRIAIICDWLTGIGGAERVVLEVHRMFPDAPIYTSQYDPKAIDWFLNADVRTTRLNRLPKRLKKFLPALRAWSFSHLKLKGYDLVISISGAEAKAVQAPPGALHISYCHAPTHYYWSRYEYYLTHPGFGSQDWLARIGLKALVSRLRKWDYKAAQRPHYMIANSTHTQAMIKKYYDRDSVVIHPPVDIERYQLAPDTEEPARRGFVITGRQTPYKRIDLAIKACGRLGLPLTVIGSGPEHQNLRKIAGPTITFVTNASDTDVARYLQSSEAFIFPTNVEDFCIAPVEAMAAGTPVIAYRAGGPLDYVVEGKTGVFFDEQTVDSLVRVLRKFPDHSFSRKALQDQAKRFSVRNFQANLNEFIEQVLTDQPLP
jgi:glycosyltransferase involved in cell wall biosynthesis